MCVSILSVLVIARRPKADEAISAKWQNACGGRLLRRATRASQ
jgi:hypothetical protein